MLAKQTGNDILWFQYESDGNRVGFTYNDTAYYYTKNAQGDVTGIVDGNCNTVVEYSYDAWGKLLSTTGSMADTIGQKNPFLYRGYYYDFETGMYYLNSRYYDPNTGRFLNADGQFNPDTGLAGNNLFTYCNNNPINASDYNGARFTESDDGSGRWVNYVNNRMYSGTGRPITGGAKSSPTQSIKTNANNVGTGLSTAAIAATTYLKLDERFKPILKSNGSVYFSKYLKNATAIKAIGRTTDIFTAGFAAWDLYDIWSNSNLTTQQHMLGTLIVGGGVLGGICVGYAATALANAWNPVGWSMLAAGAVVLGGSALVTVLQEQAYKKAGIIS